MGKTGARTAEAATSTARQEEEEEAAEAQRQLEARWSPQQRIAEALVKGMRSAWEPAMLTLARAGRAFDGLEALLGGSTFDLQARTCTCTCRGSPACALCPCTAWHVRPASWRCVKSFCWWEALAAQSRRCQHLPSCICL